MSVPGLSFAAGSALWLLLAVPVVAGLGWLLGVRRGRVRPAVLLLRTLSVALVVVAIAQPLTAAGGQARTTIFVVDRSQSVAAGNGDVEAWVNSALGQAGGGDQAAVITFGAAPTLAQPVTAATGAGSGWQGSTIDTGFSDMESALALARALPVGGSRRIVLVSDGAENLGSSLTQVSQAAADGVPIDVLPLPGVGGDDLRVDGASAPGAIWSGDSLQILASVGAGQAGPATVQLTVDGAAVASQDLTLQPGLNSVSFDVPNLAPGYHAASIQVVPGAGVTDQFTENDAYPLSVIVRDAPKLLLITAAGADSGRLKGALERKGAVVTLSTPAALSSNLPDLAVYDAFVVDNVAANAFSYDQLTGLQEATRSLGKGLVVVGGTSSYGPGSYAGSVLEETLPVTVKVTDGKERQKVALLLIIDKSGSMSYDPLGGTSKIDMAKEAAKLAVTALADGDQVGILTFSDSQQWVVPMMTIDGQATRDQIDSAIDTITADGGTEIFPALQEGFDQIRHTEADVRHVVLLSDGKSRTGTPESYDKEIAEAVADRTSLSTIAIGDDADRDLLTHIAEKGNGRYHFTDKPEDIPRLTLQEAESAGSQAVIRGSFQPIQTAPSPIMAGFTPEELPKLEGYDYAEAKPDAQVVLTSERDDPVLAKWQYGLGRVVAWLGDDGADFSLQWNEWAGNDGFWSNMVRWSLPDPENRPMNVSVQRDGPQALVTVSATGDDGSYVESAPTTASVTGPDGAVTADLPLYQSGPGQYQLRIAAPDAGSYQLALHQQRASGAVDELAAFTMPPSPELQPNTQGAALLSVIAQRTGGRVLSLDDASGLFTSDGLSGDALRTYHPRWAWPLALALLALLAELAIRLNVLRRLRGAARGAM